MSGTWQLFVVRGGLDPAAWTALHTLRERRPAWRLEALARADLWEFTSRGSLRAEVLHGWAQGANWFANATRDRMLWRAEGEAPPPLAAHAAREDGTVGSSLPGGHLLVVWREGLTAVAHEALARHAFGESVTIRRGTVWWLGGAAPDGVAGLGAAGESAGDGLFAHPESQWWRWHGASLPFPALGPEVAAELSLPAAEGVS